MKQVVLIVIFSFTALHIRAQYLPVHPTNGVYDFITELANEQLIDISTVTLPRSHREISEWLENVDETKLTARQRKELIFYRKEFHTGRGGYRARNGFLKTGPETRLDFYHYRDSSFSFTANPIGGGDFFVNQNGTEYHLWNGAEASAITGKWIFYGSLRDNHQSAWLTHPDVLDRNYGGANFKVTSSGNIDYWEYRGGISYDFGVGNIGLYKDHFSWGNNYHGASIFSGRTHSFAYIALNMSPVEWFEFHYVHGWLSSEVVDSSRSFFVSNAYGTEYRKVYHKKYLAANLFTFKPLSGIRLSVGNSIIYDYDKPHPAYFIPVMFFKAVDHHLNSGINNMNSQIFFDLSSRLIHGTHIYSTLFIDELAVKRIFDGDKHNFVSSKSGFRIESVIPGLYTGMEFTITNALTYRHFVPTTTFTSNSFNLGHYLADNAKEWYLYAGYRPVRAMDIKVSYSSAKKGPDHTLMGTLPRMSIEPFTPLVWERDRISLQFSWEVINGAYVRLGYSYSNTRGEDQYLQRYTPEFRIGKVNEINLGVNYGF